MDGVLHPVFEVASGRLSADYVGRVRQRAEARWPGSTAVWLTSAASDTFIADSTAHIPELNQEGHMVGFDGERVALPAESAPANEPMDSLAHFLTAQGAQALEFAAVGVPRFRFSGRSAWIPIRNPLIVTAASLGIMQALHQWPITAYPRGPGCRTSSSACGARGCLRYGVHTLFIHDEFFGLGAWRIRPSFGVWATGA